MLLWLRLFFLQKKEQKKDRPLCLLCWCQTKHNRTNCAHCIRTNFHFICCLMSFHNLQCDYPSGSVIIPNLSTKYYQNRIFAMNFFRISIIPILCVKFEHTFLFLHFISLSPITSSPLWITLSAQKKTKKFAFQKGKCFLA